MWLDVRLLKAENGRQESIPLSIVLDPAEAGDDVVAFPEPFVGDAVAFSTDEGIFVRLRLQGEAELQCARCLGTFRTPVTVQFTEQFREGVAQGEPGDLEVDGEDGSDFIRYQGDQIELGDLVRQHVLLELPMKPLCAAECRGLCPHCGRNLNDGPCPCGPEAADDRWHSLAEMRRRMQNPGDA